MSKSAAKAALYQVVVVAFIAAAVGYLWFNTEANLRSRGVGSGFDFLSQPASFSISEGVIPFESTDTYARALLVGLTNTLRVALLGVVLSTLAGVLIAVGRLSRNLLWRGVCAAYVEILRNVPLLLQLFVWYFLLTDVLPPIEEALQLLPHVYLSKNGLQFPLPLWTAGHALTLLGAALGGLGALAWVRHVRVQREQFSRELPLLAPALGAATVLAFIGWVAGGMPTSVDLPVRTEISVLGGGAVTPEFLTMVLGLSTYAAAYVAEVVRAGMQSIPVGQHEASAALGLTRLQELRFVQLPQALRVIVPPLTNQYLTLFKNSSLAVAIGYPDLVSISNTAISQTGRAIECVSIVASCYLVLSLFTSAFTSAYKRHKADC